jgi:hypothetical protein
MYAPFNQEDALNQGDIINNIVVTYLPLISEPSFYIDGEEVIKDLAEPFDPNEELTVLGNALKSPAMILTQGCDIDYASHICVARIQPFDDPEYDRRTNPQRRASFIKENYQKAGVRPTRYYLQESPDRHFPKSVVSFLELHTIRKTPENLEYLRRNRILRLSQEAVADLQFRIGHFFGRFAALTDDYMLTAEERALVRAR